MTRSIDNIPAEALLKGEGIFTARMVPDFPGLSVVVYNYEVNGLTLVFHSDALDTWADVQSVAFTLTRELKIGNTTYSLTAENYYIISYETQGIFSSGIAHAIKKESYSGAADVTVYELLQDIFGTDNVTMDNLYPRDVQFAPTGATITLANKADIIPILERKYFVKCFRNAGKLLFRNCSLFIETAPSTAEPDDEIPGETTDDKYWKLKFFSSSIISIAVTSYDENGNLVEYFVPPTTDPIQNLGFLPQLVDSDDVFRSKGDNIVLFSFEQRPIYRIEDGDCITFPFLPAEAFSSHLLKVIERYNIGNDPPLKMLYSEQQWRPASSASSKGVDSPLSRIGADGISFETSQLLTGILDANTTDIQRALELLSIHTHAASGFRIMGSWTGSETYVENDIVEYNGSSYVAIQENTNHIPTDYLEVDWQLIASKGDPGDPGYTQEEIEDFVGAMVTGNTETNITVTYDDSTGKLNFVAAATGGGAFQRVLSASLTLADGESLVLSSYIDIGDYDLTLDGDAELHIL